LLPNLSRPTDAENGREADHFPCDEAGLQVGDYRRQETGVLEAAREAEGAEVPLHSERRRQVERPGGNGASAPQLRPCDVAGEIGGIEVLEPAQPDEDEATTAAEIGRGHRLRHERRRFRSAYGGGDEEVLVEAAAVAVPVQTLAEPVESSPDHVDR